MKIFLASLIALSAVTGLASITHAGGSGTATGTGTSSATSVHTGTVNATCDIAVTDGALTVAAGAGLVTNITSSTDGLISTICNKSTSKLDVALGAHAIGTDDPNAGQTLVREFALTGVNGAYLGYSTPSGSIAVAKNSIHDSYSSTPSNVKVTAKVIAPSGQNLAAGLYTVNVLATVTP